ncbi:MAG: 4-(cytidine 5'-diphospho)-2-C-methyl-D-erythritol kinase [Chloroflexota bacterium]
MKTLDFKAPAKVNLTLEVLGRRPDGYHEIRSVMQTIGLWDRLRLEPGPAIEYVCRNPGWKLEKSLLPGAVKLLRERTATTRGATIKITKRIPLVSGLGGESSLAAAALRGLNQLWELNLSLTDLESLAARLGSDVTFFLRGGTALAQGRGEMVTPLAPAPEQGLVLLLPDVPEVPQKTARLYARLDESHYTRGEMTERLASRLGRGVGPLPSMLFNVFDRLAPEVFSGLKDYWQRFIAAGAETVHLAGAGPALFTLADSKAPAEAVYRRLVEQGLKTYLTTTGTFG